MPGNTPTSLLPTVLPGGSTDTGQQSSPGQPPDSVPAAAPAAAAPAGAAGPSTAGASTAVTPGAAAAAHATAAARRGRRPSRHAWYRLVSPLAVLVIWQLVSSSGLVSEQKLPSPSTVLHTAITLITTNSAAYGTLQGAMAVSLERVAIGFVLGGSVGLVLAVIAGLSRLGENAVDPLLQMLRTLPLFGLIPVFIVWFGIGELPKVLLIALGSAIPLYLNTFAGIRNVDAKLAEAGQSLGLTRAEMIRHIILPGALPQMLVGLRQSLGVAWLALVVAEQINANAGLGFMISQATQFLRNDVIFVALLVYCLLGLHHRRPGPAAGKEGAGMAPRTAGSLTEATVAGARAQPLLRRPGRAGPARPGHRARRVRRADRPQRQRQVHPAPRAGRAGPGHHRGAPGERHRRGGVPGAAAAALAPGQRQRPARPAGRRRQDDRAPTRWTRSA